MTIFLNAVFEILSSDIMLCLVGVSIPFLAVGLVSSIFITKERD